MIANQNPVVISRSPAPSPSQGQLLQATFDLCVRKIRKNIKRLADEPKSAALAVDGNYFNFKEGFYEIGNWTSSFFTGMALLAWRDTEDEYFLQQSLRLLPHYRAKVFDPIYVLDTHHDLGFLYSLYSVALHKLTGDPIHRDTGLRAAQVLSERFHEKGNFIRAWGRMDTDEFDDMAIIDCLMNLPLLYWATTQGGNPRYHEIAVRHANMALKNFVRADDSVFHAYRFDLKTGQPLQGDTYGGHSTSSHWARGTAWAIYGFALSHAHTRDRKYLDVALRLARKFIANLDDEVVPVWDFKLPSTHPRLRDASAAAVAVCGFQELARQGAADATILKAKDRLLVRMCSADYLNLDESVPGLQKQGMIGDGPGGAKNAYTSWGDYYLMEALSCELKSNETFW